VEALTSSQSTSHPSEELYDPATGTFSLTGQPSQDSDEMDEKNGQIAHQRMRSRTKNPEESWEK